MLLDEPARLVAGLVFSESLLDGLPGFADVQGRSTRQRKIDDIAAPFFRIGAVVVQRRAVSNQRWSS